jgi:HEAT repeat protein
MYSAQLKTVTAQRVKPTLADLLQALTSHSWEQRDMASAHLASFGEAATMGLVMALNHAQLDVRMRAVRLLGEIPAAAPGASNMTMAVPELIKLFNGRDLAMTATVAMTLGEIADEAAIAALRSKVNHRSAYVRAAVVAALAQLSTPQVMPELLKASQDKRAEVRAAATTGLARLRDSQVVTRLTQLLKDVDAEVRWHAERGLEALRLDQVAA